MTKIIKNIVETSYDNEELFYIIKGATLPNGMVVDCLAISESTNEYYIAEKSMYNPLNISKQALTKNIKNRLSKGDITLEENSKTLKIIARDGKKYNTRFWDSLAIEKIFLKSTSPYSNIILKIIKNLILNKCMKIDQDLINEFENMYTNSCCYSFKKYAKKDETILNRLTESEKLIISKIDKLENVLEYIEHPFTLDYEVYGKKYKYIPDFEVTLKCGKKIIVEVKVNKSEILTPLVRLKKIWFRNTYNEKYVFVLFDKINEKGYLEKLIK